MLNKPACKLTDLSPNQLSNIEARVCSALIQAGQGEFVPEFRNRAFHQLIARGPIALARLCCEYVEAC